MPTVIRMIVPFTPGASNDVFARALSEQLSTKLGITVIVENKPGAGGIIGSAEVARSKPDGATLLFSSNSFVTRAAVEEKLPFDPRKSFTPVAMVAQGAMLLVVTRLPGPARLFGFEPPPMAPWLLAILLPLAVAALLKAGRRER